MLLRQSCFCNMALLCCDPLTFFVYTPLSRQWFSQIFNKLDITSTYPHPWVSTTSPSPSWAVSLINSVAHVLNRASHGHLLSSESHNQHICSVVSLHIIRLHPNRALCCLADFWFLVFSEPNHQCWHLAEVVTVAVMTGTLRSSTELSCDTLPEILKAYFPILRIVLDQNPPHMAYHELNIRYLVGWSPTHPIQSATESAAPWKWRVQDHSHCARRPIVHLHVYLFLFLKNCRFTERSLQFYLHK